VRGVPRASGPSKFQPMNGPKPAADTGEGDSAEVQQMQVRQLAVPLLEVEAVADVELVGDDEAHVAHREIVDEAPVRPVEQGHGRDGGRATQLERAHEVVERQTGVDDVLDDQHVAAANVEIEILEHAN